MKQVVRFASTFVLAIMAVAVLGSSALAQDNSADMRAKLVGPAINHMLPRGYAEYQSQWDPESGLDKSFDVELHRIKLPNGTVLTVEVNGTAVGTIRVWEREGELNLDSQAGDQVPAIAKGDTVAVFDGTTQILGGVF